MCLQNRDRRVDHCQDLAVGETTAAALDGGEQGLLVFYTTADEQRLCPSHRPGSFPFSYRVEITHPR